MVVLASTIIGRSKKTSIEGCPKNTIGASSPEFSNVERANLGERSKASADQPCRDTSSSIG
jgi:hypothetical protein